MKFADRHLVLSAVALFVATVTASMGLAIAIIAALRPPVSGFNAELDALYIESARSAWVSPSFSLAFALYGFVLLVRRRSALTIRARVRGTELLIVFIGAILLLNVWLGGRVVVRFMEVVGAPGSHPITDNPLFLSLSSAISSISLPCVMLALGFLKLWHQGANTPVPSSPRVAPARAV